MYEFINFSFLEGSTTESDFPSTVIQESEKQIDNNLVELSLLLKSEEPPIETIQNLVTDSTNSYETQTKINDQHIQSDDIGNLPRQIHVHDPSGFHNYIKEANENEKLSSNERIETTATIAPLSTNDHSSYLSSTGENEKLPSDINSTLEIMASTIQTVVTNAKINQTLTHSESKVNYI